jgi:hypothetical protein
VTIAAAARVTWFIPPQVVGVRREGVHLQPTRVVLAFSKPMDPASAQDVNNYTLVTTGPAGSLGPRSRSIPIVAAVYDPAARAVTLFPLHRLDLHGYYRLTASGAPPRGLTSATGVPLDGSGQGRPGTVYETVLHGFGSATPVSFPVGPLGVLPRATRLARAASALPGTARGR